MTDGNLGDFTPYVKEKTVRFRLKYQLVNVVRKLARIYAKSCEIQ
jgi:hypothetical protein